MRPYLGIGFGHTPVANKGFSAFFDAGVAFGRPRIDQFDVPAQVLAIAGQAAVDQQKQDLQDKVDVTYRF